MKQKVVKINQKTVGGVVIGKIVSAANQTIEATLQFIDDTEGPTFRLNYHPKKYGKAAVLHVHLTPTSEAIPIPFEGAIDLLVRSFLKDPKGCVHELLQLVE